LRCKRRAGFKAVSTTWRAHAVRHDATLAAHSAAAGKKRTKLTLKAGTALGPIVHVFGEAPRELLDRGAVRVRSTQSTQILALPVRLTIAGAS